MRTDSMEIALWSLMDALKPRVEAARDRAEELAASSNAFDEGLPTDTVEGSPEWRKVERFCAVADTAASLADHLADRLALLTQASRALEDLGTLVRDRGLARTQGPRKSLPELLAEERALEVARG